MITIEKATEIHIPRLVDIGWIAAEEFGRRYSEDKVQRFAYDHVNLPDSISCGLVAKHEGRVVGFLLGQKVQDGFSDAVFGVEQHWYVLPEFRNTRAGFYLLDAFLYWCSVVKVDEVLVSNGDSTSVSKFLTKRGFNQSMVVHKRVNNGS